MILNRTAENGNWYPELMANAIQNHGWWVLPRGTLFRRFQALKNRRGSALLKSIPVATVGLALDIPVFLAANQKLKSKNSIGYW